MGIYSTSKNQLISKIEGKNDSVNSANLLSRNELIYASKDKNIHLINLTTKEEYIFTGHTESVSSLAVSSDKKTLVTSSYDDSIKLWDILSKRQLKTLTMAADLPSCVLFAEDNSAIYSACGGDFSVRGYSKECKIFFSEH